MKEKLSKSKGSLLGLLYVLLVIVAMGFCYIISGNGLYSVGYNGFEILSLKELGVLAGFAITFQILSVLMLIVLGAIFVLILLNNLGVIEFKVTYKNVKIESVIKVCMLCEAILSVLAFFFVLLTIVTSDYSLVFGAGTFLFMVVAIVGYVVQVVVFGKSIDKKEENQEKELEPQEHDEEPNQEKDLEMVEEKQEQSQTLDV